MSVTTLKRIRIGSPSLDNKSIALECQQGGGGFLPPRMDSAARDAIENPTDGLWIYNTDTQQNEFYSNGWPSGNTFCPIHSYSDINIVNATCSQQVVDDKPEFTTVATGANPQCFVAADTTFELLGGNTWIELTAKSTNSSDIAAGLAVASSLMAAPDVGIVANGFDDAGNGVISDISFTPILTGLTLTLPWTVQLQLNGTTGEVDWEDNQGNSGTFGVIAGLTTNSLYIEGFGGSPVGGVLGDEIVYDLNANYAAAVITPPAGYVGYCDLAPAGRTNLCGTLLPFENALGIVPTDVTVTQDDIGILVENLQASASSAVLSGPATYDTANGYPFIELQYTGRSNASIENQIGGFWGAFLGFIGVGLLVRPNTETGDGEVLLFPTEDVILSGQSIGVNYHITFGLDAQNSEIDYNDSLGNSGVIDLTTYFTTPEEMQFLELFKFASLNYYTANQIAAGIGETIEYSAQAGKYEPLDTLPAEYQGFCTVGEQKTYWFTAFAQDGDAGVNPLNPRQLILTNDIAETENPALVGVFCDFIFSETYFTTNCFEAEIVSLDADVIDEQWQVGLNAVINTDLRLTREGKGTGLTLQSEFPNNNPIPLANNLPEYVVGDVMTVCVFDNGDYPITPSVQFVYKVGPDLVIYDKLKMAPPPEEYPYTAFTEVNNPFSGNSGNLPDGNSATVQFNGIDGDYTVTDYPTDFLDYNGDPMPLSISTWTRSAEFVKWNLVGNPDTGEVVTYSNSNKTAELDLSASSVGNGLVTHLPLFMQAEGDGIIVVGMKVDVKDAASRFSLIMNGIQFDSNVIVSVSDTTGNIVLSSYVGGPLSQQIKAGVLAAGDEIYMQFNTDTGDVKAFHWDGVTVSTAQTLFDDTDDFQYLPLMLSTFTPIGAVATHTSLCKGADMAGAATLGLDSGAKDLEGVVIP